MNAPRTVLWALSLVLQIEVCHTASADPNGTADYYISTDGNDSNPGTFSQPFATLSKGVATAGAGDTVYVRGGIYHSRLYISRSGTPGAPIVFAGYPGEKAIVDGQYALPQRSGSGLVQITGDYIIVRDLTVQNSIDAGVLIAGNHDEVSRLQIYKNNGTGIWISGGSYALIEDCDISYNARLNEFGAHAPWGAGASLRSTDHATARANRIWNNWGEGLSSAHSAHTVLEQNVVWDNFAANIYFNRVQNSVIQSNVVYSTAGNPMSAYTHSEYGILMGDEATGSVRSMGNTINGNFVCGGIRAFSWWGSEAGGKFVNMVVTNNAFLTANRTTTLAPFKIADGQSDGSRIESNVIAQGGPAAIAEVPADSGLEFQHNVWSKSPPSTAAGPSDTIDDTLIAKIEAGSVTDLLPGWFRPLVISCSQETSQTICGICWRRPAARFPQDYK